MALKPETIYPNYTEMLKALSVKMNDQTAKTHLINVVNKLTEPDELLAEFLEKPEDTVDEPVEWVEPEVEKPKRGRAKKA
jgi:hypothetical protein